ncbi:hypothetical protein I79_026073 [Cricetulus griseus]|uniref:Uncharacterized protein n=1 Tax=Cricetulus griseus TaxID=10029 RepID=G3IPY8_CRIGR|nr:hypothetical protein I79_026073 [Cricetulus griseus]
MSLSAHQPKEPGQPANQLKEPSQESQILCPDPDVVSTPLCSALKANPLRRLS